MRGFIETEAVECCPHCGDENTYPGWDVERDGYIALCKSCGKQIFLCDECLHAPDNNGMRCDWQNGTCFRGVILDGR